MSCKERKIAAIGKHLAAVAKNNKSIGPSCCHIQRCLESLVRAQTGLEERYQGVLELWKDAIGKNLGWADSSEATLQVEGPKRTRLVGCSWLKCPLYGETGAIPANLALHMSRCMRCAKVSHLLPFFVFLVG